MRRLLPLLLLFATAFPARGASPFSAEDLAFFEKKVRPVLFRRCQECHSTRAKKKRGGLLLDSRAAILRGGDTGPAVVPGRPAKSLLVQAIRHEHDTVSMPPSGKLPAAEVAVLQEWVRRGAPYPGPSSPAGGKPGVDLVRGRQFWSFQPLEVHAPPAVRDPAWAKRKSDLFLFAGMEKRGLSPAPEADKRTLLRRLSFDLVGLPPSPEEIDAFLADARADAYERLVERLLATPGHGERWARFWLDLVRYCDVAEPWSESRSSPWVYRDWVVAALNDDLPYDRFVQMQLAADLLPDARPADKAALGFLGLSPIYWKELKLDHTVIKGVVAEEWEERIHTLGSAFLGLTVACARCHDHKFDPISTQDYYALAGVFASIRQADLSLLPDEQARAAEQARARLREIDKQLSPLRKQKTPDEKGKARILALTAEAQRLRLTPHLDEPLAPGVIESSLHVLADGPDRTKLTYKPAAQDVAVQVRGNPASPGPVVPRRFLAVLSPGEPRPFGKGSGRLELARAITGEAGPLAARVMVNRVWKHHFGEGLVRTPSDFGAQGEKPTHPELLDDLAARFAANGWSLKWLHREIVLSSAYRQSSRSDDRTKAALDPDNRLLARRSRRRLEIEAWRDAVLTAAGALDGRMGGPPQDLGQPANTRRTLYGSVKRRELHDLLRLHDFPDPTTHSASRTPTTTPLQQLFVLNSPFIRAQSAALASRLHRIVLAGAERGERSSLVARRPPAACAGHGLGRKVTGEAQRIRCAYRLLFGRTPTRAEEKLGLDFLEEAGVGAWAQYAQVLLASNEFLYVD
jgi:hypothetical protein